MRATPTGSTPGRSPGKGWGRGVPGGPATICRSCGISAATPRRGPPRRPYLAAGGCPCPGHCSRASGWPSPPPATCVSHRLRGAAARPPTWPGSWRPSTATTTRSTRPHWPTPSCWPTIPTGPLWCSAGGSSAELAGDPAVEDVAGDGDRRRERPRAGSRAQLVAGEPAGLLDLVRVQPQRVAGLRARHEPQHQGLGERPRLAADVTEVGDLEPDLLGDLPRDRGLGRFPRLDEPREDREAPRRPDRLPAEYDAVGAVVDEHDHGRVGAGEELRTGGRVPLHPAGPFDRRGRTGERAEPVSVVPLQDPHRLHEQPCVEVVEVGSDLAQPRPRV